MTYKIPISVLVVIHTAELQVLLLERADHPGWWQSVTGSQEPGETLKQTAIREVAEETGIDARRHTSATGAENEFEIYDCYRHRYAPGTTHNAEHVFGLLLPGRCRRRWRRRNISIGSGIRSWRRPNCAFRRATPRRSDGCRPPSATSRK